MSIKIVSTSIFDSPAHALVNPVNCVGVMGAGLALEFKKRFPANFDAYKAQCLRGRVDIGLCFVHQDRLLNKDGKIIINFPTKRHWRNESRLEYIERGLDDLANILEGFAIRSVSVPMLGCGLGGLDDRKVLGLIHEQLGRSMAEVLVHVHRSVPSNVTAQRIQGIKDAKA